MYTPIPIKVSNTTQHVYVRPQLHENEAENSVFITNLPLDTTEDNIKDLCKALGDVVLNGFERLGTRHGLINLMDKHAQKRFLSKANKLTTKHKKLVDFEHYGPKGAEGYLAHHYSKFPKEKELMQIVDEYMELFAQQEQLELEEAQRAAETVDEDGFRLVVNKNRKRLSDIEAPVLKKKKKTLEKTDFYRFQLRDKRKREMTDLLKRYQQDKEKVEELKKKREFKPF